MTRSSIIKISLQGMFGLRTNEKDLEKETTVQGIVTFGTFQVYSGS